MHRSRCFAASAEGGFKINGPPINGKDPMSNEEDKKSSNEASPPQPTQAGRIETCTELISKAMRCLENNDKQCVTRLIEELIKANCHDGNAVGREIADKVKDLVHEMWLRDRGNDEYRCGLLRMLRDLNVSKRWVKKALCMVTKMLNKWLRRCVIDWESKTTRYSVVKEIKDLLRDKLGWNEIKMCEEMWKFIDVDVNAFRRRGIEPCIWLNGLELLSDLRRPYWLGLRASDLVIRRHRGGVESALNTTNSVDAIFFLTLLGTIKTPSLAINWKREAPATKYAFESIVLSYYVYLSANAWPWPIELSASELERVLDGFGGGELTEFIAGLLDGDGAVVYYYNDEPEFVFVWIAACRDCPKRFILDVLKRVIAERFGIISNIYFKTTSADALMFYNRNAISLLRHIIKYIHHPLKRLRAELILAYYDGRISRKEFKRLYDMTKYEQGAPDIKRNHGLEALARAAPQTHTHGGQR